MAWLDIKTAPGNGVVVHGCCEHAQFAMCWHPAELMTALSSGAQNQGAWVVMGADGLPAWTRQGTLMTVDPTNWRHLPHTPAKEPKHPPRHHS